MTDAVAGLAPGGGLVAAACVALGVSRASVQRRRARLAAPPVALCPRPRPARALSVAQQQAVLDLLHAPRFADQAPAEIYASLLDRGVYHCSIPLGALAPGRTVHRLLGRNGEVRERRQQLRHSAYQKPELLAERPNEVWSWDITKLMGPAKWSCFYLYVILDIPSRRVVGWCVADAESAALFRPLLDDAVAKHDVPPGQLTLHADRGGPMCPRHCPAARRPRGDAPAQPPAHVQRQPLLRKPLQDPEASAALSPALRLHRGCQELLPPVLRLM